MLSVNKTQLGNNLRSSLSKLRFKAARISRFKGNSLPLIQNAYIWSVLMFNVAPLAPWTRPSSWATQVRVLIRLMAGLPRNSNSEAIENLLLGGSDWTQCV